MRERRSPFDFWHPLRAGSSGSLLRAQSQEDSDSESGAGVASPVLYRPRSARRTLPFQLVPAAALGYSHSKTFVGEPTHISRDASGEEQQALSGEGEAYYVLVLPDDLDQFTSRNL